uniref:Cytochrome P450 71A1 n=1 Tax=Anthurium amnicola TaxID=1678845 RepID=A0A1D1Y4L7_9ARAE
MAPTPSSVVQQAAAGTVVPAGLACLLAVALLLLYLRRSRKLNLPPTPPGLPLVGNLPQLGELPHRSLRRLALRHGPLMYLRLGHVPTLVVSNADMAQEVLKTHDAVFCTRPTRAVTTRFSYGGLGVAFAPYSDGWRHLRKIAMLELFSAKRAHSFRPIREQEVGALLRTVADASTGGRPVDLSAAFLCLFNNITCRQAFGKRSSDDGRCGRSKFHDMLMDSIELFGGFCASDFFPSMAWLNVLTGFHARLEKAFHSFDSFLEQEIEAHLRRDDDSGDDFLSVLLRLQKDPSLGFHLTREHIKAVLVDVFFAGSDTSASTTEFGMLELARNPRVMKKAQEEIRRVLGRKPAVEESDLPNLPYLKLVVKEVLRLRPSVPLPLPHESMEDVRVAGYDVPAKTMVFINVWAIARDPQKWGDDPEAFRPERFECSSLQYKGQDFQYIPFSSGRRICPGMTLGVSAVELALANLLHCFDWELPDGMKPEDIDTTESFGLVVHLKSPLLLNPTPVNFQLPS